MEDHQLRLILEAINIMQCAVTEKLEEIRCGLIDIEEGSKKKYKGAE